MDNATSHTPSSRAWGAAWKRRLVYNLRPPALDDLGLVAAIRAQAMHYEHPGLCVNVEAPNPLPELPAAVEVAAYRSNPSPN